jgi:hypothetical protein
VVLSGTVQPLFVDKEENSFPGSSALCVILERMQRVLKRERLLPGQFLSSDDFERRALSRKGILLANLNKYQGQRSGKDAWEQVAVLLTRPGPAPS